MSNITVPYTKTNGCSMTSYCQIDHEEMYGVSDLVDHANKLIIDTQKENQQLKELLKEACEVIKHYDYPDVGMEGNIIIKSGCVANDFINQPKVKAILSNQ